jgi:hypothetical protein
MADARPEEHAGQTGRPGAQHDTKDEVQDTPMPEYELEQRRKESETIIERADGEGEDDGSAQVFGPSEAAPPD